MIIQYEIAFIWGELENVLDRNGLGPKYRDLKQLCKALLLRLKIFKNWNLNISQFLILIILVFSLKFAPRPLSVYYSWVVKIGLSFINRKSRDFWVCNICGLGGWNFVETSYATVGPFPITKFSSILKPLQKFAVYSLHLIFIAIDKVKTF